MSIFNKSNPNASHEREARRADHYHARITDIVLPISLAEASTHLDACAKVMEEGYSPIANIEDAHKLAECIRIILNAQRSAPRFS